MNKVIKIIKIMSVIALVLTAGVAINRFFTGAEQIIRHWNFEGTVDGYAPKVFILLIPLLSIFLFFLVQYYIKNPYKMSRKSNIKKNEYNLKLLTLYCQVIQFVICMSLFYLTLASAGYIMLHIAIIYLIAILMAIFFFYMKHKLQHLK